MSTTSGYTETIYVPSPLPATRMSTAYLTAALHSVCNGDSVCILPGRNCLYNNMPVHEFHPRKYQTQSSECLRWFKKNLYANAMKTYGSGGATPVFLKCGIT